MRATLLAGLALLAATPASADWAPANPTVAKAARDPSIAAVLALINRKDAAMIAGDKERFIADFARDAIIHNPTNKILTRADVVARYEAGILTYKYLHRRIEYAARRRDDEVVLMGEETYEPPTGAPHAGRTVRRRFTDLWRKNGKRWELSLRQATIIAVE